MKVNRNSHALAACALLVAGCGTLSHVSDSVGRAGDAIADWAPNFIKPYRPDVPQGNIVTREMVDQLQPGMSPDQVRFLLGTPLLANAFRTDRWDYVYFLRRKDGTTQERQVVVYFKDGRLDHFDAAADLPQETLADNLILGRKPQAAPKPPPKEPEPAQISVPTSK